MSESLDELIFGLELNREQNQTTAPTAPADSVECQKWQRRGDYCQIITWMMDGRKVIAVRASYSNHWFETAINFDPSQEEDYVYAEEEICPEYYRSLRPATFDDIIEWLENPNIKHIYDLNTLCYSKEDRCFYIHTRNNFDEDDHFISNWKSEPLEEPVISINLLDSPNSRRGVYYDKNPKDNY